MKNVIVITTRQYPDNINGFEELMDSQTYLDGIGMDAETIFKPNSPGSGNPTWVTKSGYEYKLPLAIQYKEINENLSVYVAPCIINTNCLSIAERHKYISNILNIVLTHLGDEDFKGYIFTHDRDILDPESPQDRCYCETDFHIEEGQFISDTFSEPLKKFLGGDLNRGYMFSHSSYLYEYLLSYLSEEPGRSLEDRKNKAQEIHHISLPDFDCNIDFSKKESDIFSGGKSDVDIDAIVSKICNNTEDRQFILYEVDEKTYGMKLLRYEKDFINGLSTKDSTIRDRFKQKFYELKGIRGGIRYPIIHFIPDNISDWSNSVRIIRYFDSSIWNFYVNSSLSGDELKMRVRQVVEDIVYYWKNDYYNVDISTCYADFNFRLLEQSYLRDVHGDYVAPFPFHSESFMRSEIDKFIKNQKYNIISDYRWHFLLIDDKSDLKLKGSSKLNKSAIIRETLRKIFNNENNDHEIICVKYGKELNVGDVNQNTFIVIDYVENKEDALKAIKEKKYDIILLDYLLDSDNLNSNVCGEDYRYGYSILKDLLQKDEKNLGDYGPHKRLYFMFTSAYTTAVNDMLLAQALPKGHKNWFIMEGACPTNTPYLFRYNLLNLMYKRIEACGIEKLIIPDYIEEEIKFKGCYIKSRIIDDIYGKDNPRKEANDKFDKVLSLLYHYKKLLRDVHITQILFNSHGSVLASDFIEKNPDLGGFLEHLMQLVYLTAYGTVRQWPEMWEEYQFIKSMVGPLDNIEQYIFKLKNNINNEN